MNGVVSSLLSTKLNGALHHGVLPHENHRVATQTFPYALELRRANVFGGHDQNLGILAQKTPELLVVQGFLLGPRGFHGHFFNGWQREKKKKKKLNRRKGFCGFSSLLPEMAAKPQGLKRTMSVQYDRPFCMQYLYSIGTCNNWVWPLLNYQPKFKKKISHMTIILFY